MFVTVSAILCHLLANSPVCVEEIITDSSMEPALTWQGCIALGQAPIAKWKSEHPLYHNDSWYIEKYRCTPGHYEIKGRA